MYCNAHFVSLLTRVDMLSQRIITTYLLFRSKGVQSTRIFFPTLESFSPFSLLVHSRNTYHHFIVQSWCILELDGAIMLVPWIAFGLPNRSCSFGAFEYPFFVYQCTNFPLPLSSATNTVKSTPCTACMNPIASRAKDPTPEHLYFGSTYMYIMAAQPIIYVLAGISYMSCTVSWICCTGAPLSVVKPKRPTFVNLLLCFLFLLFLVLFESVSRTYASNNACPPFGHNIVGKFFRNTKQSNRIIFAANRNQSRFSKPVPAGARSFHTISLCVKIFRPSLLLESTFPLSILILLSSA